MNNIGSIFRTADAFRVEKIILCGISPIPPHNDIHKTALGAEDAVPWVYVEDTKEIVERLKQDGYHILCLEQCFGSVMLDKFECDTNDRYAIVLGNEVHGVSDGVVDIVDTCLEIPQKGTKHSLNVSVATGIALWHIAKEFIYSID